MTRFALAFLLATTALSAPALAQSPVTVIGQVSPGNCVQFNSTTIIRDAGAPCGSSSGFVVGPGSSVVGELAFWNNLSGTALADATGISALPGFPLTIKPTAATLNQGFFISQSGPASGSVAGPTNMNLITASYSSTTTGTGEFADFGAWDSWVTPWRVNFTVGGANLGGEPLGAGFFHSRLTTATPFSADVIGVAGATYANVSATLSQHYGAVGAVIIDGSANVLNQTGLFGEVDIINGATVASRRGVSATNQGTATASGIDTAYQLASNNTGGSFKTLMTINTQGGAVSPLQTTGDFFKADAAFTIANIFNLPNTTVTGSILNFPNVVLSGAAGLSYFKGTAFGFGTETNPQTTVVVSKNVTTGLPAPVQNPLLQLVAADSAPAYLDLDGYGSGAAGTILYRLARGTAASPSNLVSGDTIGAFQVRPYTNSAFALTASASINFKYLDSSPNTGTGITIGTTPAGTTTQAEAARFGPSGGFTVGTTADPGIGVINALNGYDVNGVAGASCTLTTVSHLTVVKGMVTLCN